MGYPTTFAGWKTYIRDYIDADDYSDTKIESFMNEANVLLNEDLDSQWTETLLTFTWTGAGRSMLLADITTLYNRMINVNALNGASLRGLAINEMLDEIASYFAGTSTSIPNDDPYFYCVSDQRLYVFPVVPDGTTMELRYDPIVPPLSSTVDSNIFTVNHPDLYLYACCVAASIYMVEDERVDVWKGEYAKKLNSANLNAKRSKIGATPLTRSLKVLNYG